MRAKSARYVINIEFGDSSMIPADLETMIDGTLTMLVDRERLRDASMSVFYDWHDEVEDNEDGFWDGTEEWSDD